MGSDLEPPGQVPGDRADVVFHETSVSMDGIRPKVHIASRAPVGSPSEAASAMLQASLAGSLAALAATGVCLLAGTPVWVTITSAMVLIIVVYAVIIWVIVRNNRRV